MPITFVKENEQFYNCPWNDTLANMAKKNMKNSKGLPIGVQVASQLHNEEIVLRVMKEFESMMGDIEYPYDIEGLN